MELRTARLRLRRLRPGDEAGLVAYKSLPEVARYQSWDTFGPDAAARMVADQAAIVPDTPGTWVQLAIVPQGGGELAGDCGIHFRSDDLRQVELGVTLAPAHQGRGLAAEALTAVLGYVFDRLGKHRALAVTDADNRPAGRSSIPAARVPAGGPRRARLVQRGVGQRARVRPAPAGVGCGVAGRTEALTGRPPTGERMERLLRELLYRLEAVGDRDESLYDSAVREVIGDAIFFGFIKPRPGFFLPDDYGMPDAENRLIREALRAYIEGVTALAPAVGVKTFRQRLAAVQNPRVRTDAQKNDSEEFFGWSDPALFDEAGDVIRRG